MSTGLWVLLIVLALVVLMTLALVATQLPEIRRYMKIKSM